MWLWLLRFLGIFLVISGLKGIFNFLETLAKVVPFIANIIGAGVGLVCSLAGFAWSFIVIAIAWLAYRPVLGISLIIIAVALIIFLSRKKKAATAI